jgi:hypothetical protein
MDLRSIDKTIGYGVIIIIGYHIIGVFIPILTWGVIGLVIFRIYLTYQNHKR